VLDLLAAWAQRARDRNRPFQRVGHAVKILAWPRSKTRKTPRPYIRGRGALVERRSASRAEVPVLSISCVGTSADVRPRSRGSLPARRGASGWCKNARARLPQRPRHLPDVPQPVPKGQAAVAEHPDAAEVPPCLAHGAPWARCPNRGPLSSGEEGCTLLCPSFGDCVVLRPPAPRRHRDHAAQRPIRSIIPR